MIVELSFGAIAKVDRHQEFNLAVHHVVDFFHECLGSYSCGKFKKIAIRYYNFEPRNKCFAADDVLLINLNKPISEFFKLDVDSRRYWTAHELYEALIIADEYSSIGRKMIDSAYSTMLANEVRRYGRIGNVILLTNGMLAQVCYHHTEEWFRIFVRICNGAGIRIRDEDLVKVKPYHLEYSRYIGRVTNSGDTVVLSTIDGRQQYEIQVRE